MSKILLGRRVWDIPGVAPQLGDLDVTIDLDILMQTRLLIQAGSGSGKSYLLRRLAEQTFGKVPIIIIDPEGEFASLREKFGFVLVGKNGETPADIRSAGLVAHKLMELNASAVIDLFEMKPHERHIWVQRFAEAAVEAPKKLWHPRLLIVDEGHIFCPERGEGESCASGAMIDLSSRGRKRGWCLTIATQRLAKLNKNLAAELQNVLVGNTFIDVDRERAAGSLGISRSKASMEQFNNEIKVLKPGSFYGLGRAISTTRILVQVGDVVTTHPKAGSKKLSLAAPPTPAAIKGLLPSLSDLPEEAEQEARTVAELKVALANAKRELRDRPVETVEKTDTKVEIKKIPVPVLTTQQLARIDKLLDRVDKLRTDTTVLSGEINAQVGSIGTSLKETLGLFRATQQSTPPVAKKETGLARYEGSAYAAAPPRPAASYPPPPIGTDEARDIKLVKASRAILQVLAQHQRCDLSKLALLAGYAVAGSFKDRIRELKQAGMIMGDPDGYEITTVGANQGPFEPLPTGESLWQYWMNHDMLVRASRAILDVLRGSPGYVQLLTLARDAGYEVAGSFKDRLRELRKAGLIVQQGTNYSLHPDFRAAIES